jgi:hypothetical protein
MRASVGFVLCLFGCVAGSPELGENDEGLLHLKGGDNATPTFVDEGTQLRVTGAFAGVGNKDMKIHLETHGLISGSCLPRGSAFATDLPIPVAVEGDTSTSVDISALTTKNGWTPFELLSPAPAFGYFGVCSVTDMRFTSATITVWQANEITFTQTWSL